MIDMLAQPVGAQHETAGTEGALVQALDRLRVVGGFGQYCEGEIAHDEARNSIWRTARSIAPPALNSGLFQFLLTGAWDK